MSDGRVLTIGGSWNGNLSVPRIGEVWSETAGWKAMTNITTKSILTPNALQQYSDNYRWMFSLENHTVFVPGPSSNMTFYTTAGTGGETVVGRRPGFGQDEYFRAVMYEPDTIMWTGGYQNGNQAGDWDAWIMKLDGQKIAPPKSIERIARMNIPRAYNNHVLLPSGDVIVFGGQTAPRVFTDFGAVFIPELWNSVTRNWTQLAPCKEARTYHSVAILLPSGQVFTGGGGLCNPVLNGCPPNSVNHLNYEIFTPPYLLNANGTDAPRPKILAAPTWSPHGVNISVTTDTAVASFAIVRSSATTHAANNDQRRVVLPIVGQVTNANGSVKYSLAVPLSRGVVVPGIHMLFAMGLDGTPSVARFFKCAFP